MNEFSFSDLIYEQKRKLKMPNLIIFEDINAKLPIYRRGEFYVLDSKEYIILKQCAIYRYRDYYFPTVSIKNMIKATILHELVHRKQVYRYGSYTNYIKEYNKYEFYDKNPFEIEAHRIELLYLEYCKNKK
jgi:hypothetical protein